MSRYSCPHCGKEIRVNPLSMKKIHFKDPHNPEFPLCSVMRVDVLVDDFDEVTCIRCRQRYAWEKYRSILSQKGDTMKQENVCILKLVDRDVRMAAANGGLPPINLPPGTTQVIIRVVQSEDQPGEGDATP